MDLKNNAGGWLLPEGRRTKDLGCLCATVTDQVISSLTCNTKCMLQIHCCQPLCLGAHAMDSAIESQPSLTSSFPSLRPCLAHGAPAQLLCSIPAPRGRMGQRSQRPAAKVKAGKEGSVSSIRSAQSASCFSNPSAPGLRTGLCARGLDAAVHAAPPSPCPHCTASLQHPGREMGKRSKEEAVDHENLPELFPALRCSVLVGNMDFEIDLTPTEVQKPRPGTPDFFRRRLRARSEPILVLQLSSIFPTNTEVLRSGL